MAARSRRPRGASKWQRGATPRGDEDAAPLRLGAVDATEEHPDGAWVVRRVRATGGSADYRCPGCHGLLSPRTPHVVAWRADRPLLGGQAADARRHWHGPCWDRRSRTGR